MYMNLISIINCFWCSFVDSLFKHRRMAGICVMGHNKQTYFQLISRLYIPRYKVRWELIEDICPVDAWSSPQNIHSLPLCGCHLEDRLVLSAYLSKSNTLIWGPLFCQLFLTSILQPLPSRLFHFHCAYILYGWSVVMSSIF